MLDGQVSEHGRVVDPTCQRREPFGGVQGICSATSFIGSTSGRSPAADADSLRLPPTHANDCRVHVDCDDAMAVVDQALADPSADRLGQPP